MYECQLVSNLYNEPSALLQGMKMLDLYKEKLERALQDSS